MEPIVIRMSLPATIASILGRQDEEGYRNIGQAMKAKELYQIIGLTNTPMLYKYMNGSTKTIEAERALVILEKFNVLIDLWSTEEELRESATNRELSAKIAREPLKKIINELVEVESNDDPVAVKRGLRKLIAKYY